jgi:hypothetical protein
MKQKVDDEGRADHICDPVDFLRPPRQCFQQRIGEKPEGQPLPNAVGEGHHQDGEKGWYHSRLRNFFCGFDFLFSSPKLAESAWAKTP